MKQKVLENKESWKIKNKEKSFLTNKGGPNSKMTQTFLHKGSPQHFYILIFDSYQCEAWSIMSNWCKCFYLRQVTCEGWLRKGFWKLKKVLWEHFCSDNTDFNECQHTTLDNRRYEHSKENKTIKIACVR